MQNWFDLSGAELHLPPGYPDQPRPRNFIIIVTEVIRMKWVPLLFEIRSTNIDFQKCI